MNDYVNFKKTILYKSGYTDDIVKSIINVFERNKKQCTDISKHFKGYTIEDTCRNVSDYVCRNIKYKIDPDGEQWIKTPARFVYDAEGDCKSYSIFICSVLYCLGIKSYFRFVSYTPQSDYTHVYAVAIDEKGKELIIDCVAIQQQRCNIFQELKFFKKLDIMNGTLISCISGIGEVSNNKISFSKNDKIPTITAKCFELYSFADESQQKNAKVLNYIVSTYTSKENLNVGAFVFATFFNSSAGYETILSYLKSFINGRINPNSPYKVDLNELDDNQLTIYNWFNDNITEYCDKSYYIDVTDKINEILSSSILGLYIFAEDNCLNKIQKIKKSNQLFYFKRLTENTGITSDACKLIIYAGIVEQYGLSPLELLNKLFPKQEFYTTNKNFIAGDIEWNPLEGTYFSDSNTTSNKSSTTSTSTTSTSTTSTSKTKTTSTTSSNWWDVVLNGVKSLSESFTKVFSAVSNKSISNVAVSQTDSSSSGISISSIIPFIIIGLGGFLLITKKRKRK